MKRSAPLRRVTSLKNRSSLSPSRKTRRPSHKNAAWRKVHAEVKARTWCEASTPACPDGRHRGEHAHHVTLRAQGGPDEAWNLLWVCFAGHDFIHRNVGVSVEHGWIRQR